MTNDKIVESIRAICAPLPECRALAERIITELEIRAEAMTLAVHAFAQYALEVDAPPINAIADFESGFVQDAELRRAVKLRKLKNSMIFRRHYGI